MTERLSDERLVQLIREHTDPNCAVPDCIRCECVGIMRDLAAARSDLADALKYAHHTAECDYMQDTLPCTCGLYALLRKHGGV